MPSRKIEKLSAQTAKTCREAKRWVAFQLLYYRNKFLRNAKIEAEPIFIVGCGHSGTSLLLAILGAHSRIFAAPFESRIAKKATWRFRAGMRKFERWAIANGKIRWAEKTPGHILRID